MPSGAKKRKAAKKKKGNQPSNHPSPSSSASTHAHGGDDAKHQEDKDSEVSSPASQDHHSQHNLLTEGEEEEIDKREKDLNLPSVEGTKIEAGDERNIVVEGAEEESSEKNGRFEHDETSRKSYDGGSSGSSGSSSSSSSDDESHGTKSNQAVVHITPIVDSVKVADTFSGEHVEAIDSTHVEGPSSSIIENVTPVVSEKIPEKAKLDMSSPANNSAVPPIVESVFSANGEKKQSSVEEQVGVSEASNDAASHEKEAIIPSVENIAQENNDQLNLSYNEPAAAADNGRDAEKDSGVTEPLLVPAPHAEQTTSWKSCCGLFELFSGSGR
ncbi:hypothetical protein ACS0TY_017962 [Phlomoides rotata]